MLGALITLLYCAASVGLGRWILSRWTAELDPAARFGVHGLTGLVATGTLTLFIGLIPGGLKWGVGVIGVLALLGLAGLRGQTLALKLPKDGRLAAVGAIAIAGLFALMGVLAPSDTVDWDSLAYHMAVPKLWLAAGQIQFVSFIHHSNFPFSVDNLYIWGLAWGGQAGAKAFSIGFFVFGVAAIFGLARTQYGEKAGWWSSLIFGTTPMVVWLTGSAYIDVANGLFAGLGILFTARWLTSKSTPDAVLAGVFAGMCMASKYTGLQILFAIFAILAIYGVLNKDLKNHARAVALIGGIAVAISCPWYVKNIINTGNPVYPFFYSVFGGKNWDAFSEKIYKEQQQTFGTGRPMPEDGSDYVSHPLEPARLGGSILGLAYQPGRYIDPHPTAGGGVPFGSLGFVALASGLWWLASGRSKRFELSILASIGLCLVLWFFLSQQSRYILGLTVPLCVLAGGVIATLRLGVILAAGAILQAGLGLYAIKSARTDTQLQVVTGKVTSEQYQTELVRFYEPAQWINENVNGKIGLYDEVFGFFLDMPYFWAGPGHTTELDYEHLSDGQGLIDKLKNQSITAIYIDLSTTFGPDHEKRDQWIAAAGIQAPPHPYSQEDIAENSKDIRNKFKILLAEAIATGQLKLVKAFGSRLIFELQ